MRKALESKSGGNDVETDLACASDADDKNKEAFVDVVGKVGGEEGAESEAFTFADAFIRTNLLSETILECLSNIRTTIVLFFILQS